MLTTKSAIGEIKLKDIFSIPNQINIKTGSVGTAQTRNEIKTALQKRLIDVLETKKNLLEEKTIIVSTLINNVISALKRSGGVIGITYGTQLSKETLQDFNEIIESILQIKDPESLLNKAVLEKLNKQEMDPGKKRTEAKPEDEPEDAQTPKTVELTLQQWINFLKYYDQQHKDLQGDYYILNPISIYNEYKKIDDFTTQINYAEEKLEQILGKQQYDLFFDFIRVDLQKLNDSSVNIKDTNALKKLFLLYAKIEHAWSGKISTELNSSEEKSNPKLEEGSTANLMSEFIGSLEEKITPEEAKKIRIGLKSQDNERLKKEADKLAQEQAEAAKKEASVLKIQKLYREHAARKKLAEEVRIKEEERKAKEEAEAKKKAAEEQKKKDDEELLRQEELKKKEAEAKKKADEDERLKKEQDDAKLAADKLVQEQAEATKQEESKKATPLEHPTKQRAHQKKRKPTQTGKKYQQQKQELELMQIEHQKKVDTLSYLINLAEAKISTSEGEIPTFQAIKDDKLTQEQLDKLKKELESKINEANQYTDIGNLIESFYKTDKTLESKIGTLTEILNKLFPDSEDIKQFGPKILDISKMVIKLEPQECIDRICSLVESAEVGQGILKAKLYDKKIPKATQSSISEFKTKIISLTNRLSEPIDATTIQKAIDKLGDKEFKHIEQAFLNLNYTPNERQVNPKLDIINTAIETRTQKTKSEQDKKAQDAAASAAAQAKTAQEKKLSAAAEKKQGEETAKAKVKQDWDSEIAKIQQIAPENIQISDLDFIKEDKYKGLNFDATSSSLILKFIQNLCKELDQKNDEYLRKLSDLLIKIKNKIIFDKDLQQQKDFNLFEKYLNTWNLLNKIYQKRDTLIENVSLSGIQLTKAQAYVLKQSADTNISEIKDYANALKDAKKYQNLPQLLKKMIQANIIAHANLQIVYTILYNVLDSKYEQFLTTIKNILESPKQKASVPPQKTGTTAPIKPTAAQAKLHEPPKSSALKTKLVLLKQNLEKLKIKLSLLSQKLGQLKAAL